MGTRRVGLHDDHGPRGFGPHRLPHGTLVDETARAQTAAVLSGSAGDLDRASDLSAQLAPSLAALTDGGGGALPAAANELATAAGDLDAAATAAARLLASGDAEGAARTMASDGVTAMAALDAGRPALVNVVTDWRARASTASFTKYVT